MFRNEHTGTDYVQVFSLIRFDSCRPFHCVMGEKGWRGKKERSVSENYEMCQRKRELHYGGVCVLKIRNKCVLEKRDQCFEKRASWD